MYPNGLTEQRVVKPDRIVSNFVDNLELDQVVLGIGHHNYDSYNVSGGKRFFPASDCLALFLY